MVENARQRAMESFRQFEKDCDFRNAHLDEWHQEHGHQWVAVFQEELVATAGSKEKLYEELEVKGISKKEAVRAKLGVPRTIPH